MWKPGFDPWVVNIPWRRAWQPTPVFLTGESPWTEPSGLHANYRVTKSRPRRSGQHSTQLIYNIVSGSGVQRSDSVLYKYIYIYKQLGSQVVLTVKNPPAKAGHIRDSGSIPGSGRSPGEGNGNPLQYSRLENSMDGGSLAGNNPRGRKESDMTEN